jgi:hypothetical protein
VSTLAQVGTIDAGRQSAAGVATGRRDEGIGRSACASERFGTA